jgi:hypothetical protein
MITTIDAIRSLAPGASYAIIGDEIVWNSPDITQPTQAEIDAEIVRLQAEQDATQYRRNRATEYPEIGDQLDAILKHLNYRRTQGDELIQQLDDIIGDWLSVKSRHPKP